MRSADQFCVLRAVAAAQVRGEVPGPVQRPGEPLPVFPRRGDAWVSGVPCSLGQAGKPWLVLPRMCFREVVGPAVTCGARKPTTDFIWRLERTCG